MSRAQNYNSNGEIMRDTYVEHADCDFICDDDGMTRQEFKDECDINILLAQYEKTGQLNHFNPRSPQYFDATGLPADYLQSMMMIREAGEAFMRLPAAVRKTFDNDPEAFVAFAADPDNLEQMREWGLAPPAPAPEEPKLDPGASAPAAPGNAS